MRSYYIYVRTPDNDFHKCNIVVKSFTEITAEELWENLQTEAIAQFKRMGVKLPDTYRMRILPDYRNKMTWEEYEEDMLERKTKPPPKDSYCVASEYIAGKTVRH